MDITRSELLNHIKKLVNYNTELPNLILNKFINLENSTNTLHYKVCSKYCCIQVTLVSLIITNFASGL